MQWNVTLILNQVTCFKIKLSKYSLIIYLVNIFSYINFYYSELLSSFFSPACRGYEFSCDSGAQCVPQAWHCDGETDCLDGSDEQQCVMPCGPAQMSCQSGDQCVNRQNLCDGTPHCRDASDESIDNCGNLKCKKNI